MQLSTILPTAAALSAALVAQSAPDSANPRPPRDSGIRIPRIASRIHTGPSDSGVEYGIWACGADYKVSFHGPMTFVPYLGADYPYVQPFAWTTRSVRIGGDELTPMLHSLGASSGRRPPPAASYALNDPLGRLRA